MNNTKHRILGNYKILEELNSGGAATIYLAENTENNKKVALKILYEHLSRQAVYRRRLQREVKYISKIDHPNLIKVNKTGIIEDRCFIEMEYFPCVTLKEWIEKQKKVDLNDFFNIAIQIASGLEALHRNDILHRDLSYGNILIGENNHVKLTDFGIIKILPDCPMSTEITELTDAGMTYGTLPFMSPEQCEGRPVDKSSDIFAFGVNIYYMLTGELPFKGESSAAVISSIIKYEPPGIIEKNSDISFDLNSLIFNLLSKRKSNRIQDIAEIKDILKMQSKQYEFEASTNKKSKFDTYMPVIAILISLLAVGLLMIKSKSTKEIPGNLKKNISYGQSSLLNRYLSENFSVFYIKEPVFINIDTEEAEKIRIIFLRLITLIKNKTILLIDDPDVRYPEDSCMIAFVVERQKNQYLLSEKWKSPILPNALTNKSVLEISGNNNQLTDPERLFLNTAFFRNQVMVSL